MPSPFSADEKLAAMLAHDVVPNPLRAVLQAAREGSDIGRCDLSDPLVFRAQVKRMATLFHALYGSDASAQARKVAERFDNNTFARMVTAAVERDARAEERESAAAEADFDRLAGGASS